MRSFLNFGTLCYLGAIGVQAFMFGVFLWGKAKICKPFVAYIGFVAIRSLLMVTLLSEGNGGWYEVAYRAGHTVEFGFLMWVMVDICGRWRKWTAHDLPIVEGIVIMQLFPAILLSRAELPLWTMYIPTYAYIVAQAVWIRGLILKPQEDV